MDKAQQDALMDQMNKAILTDDMDTAVRLGKMVPMPAEMADALRMGFGPEYLKNSGFNLSEAEERYGKDWLSKSE